MSETVDIAIIGAGFSGLGLAVRLREQGVEDFVILERNADVGGTWWANTYPGCACDVPSHLYSFSFAPNPDWSRTYSPQPEIRAYLERVARERDLYRSIRFGTSVTGADWDDAAGRWALATSAGPVSARVLVAAPGTLTEPQPPRPARPGIVRGHDVPLGALGPRPRPARRARGGDRHRRVGDPARPRDPARRRPAARLPAHRAVGDAAHRARDPVARARLLPPRPGRTARGPRRRLRRPRAARARLHPAPGAAQGRRAALAPPPARPGRRPGAARPRHARLRDRLQADPALQPLVSGAHGAERRARHRRDPGGDGRRDRDRRRDRAGGRHDHLRHRLPRRRDPGRALDPRPRRASCCPTPGPAARARTSAARSPASPTCSCCSARTPASGTARWST